MSTINASKVGVLANQSSVASQQTKQFNPANSTSKKIAVLPGLIWVGVNSSWLVPTVIAAIGAVGTMLTWDRTVRFIRDLFSGNSDNSTAEERSKASKAILDNPRSRNMPADARQILQSNLMQANSSDVPKTEEEQIQAELNDLVARDPFGKGFNRERILELKRKLNKIRDNKAKAENTNTRTQASKYNIQSSAVNGQVEALQKQLDRLLNNGSSNNSPEAQRAIADLKRRINDLKNS